ncbi:hypothetical protein G6F68_021071 [Rhizopus microsporus]|nr:hypothetical protein G6F68_021071 [Rhizopus microsporus]
MKSGPAVITTLARGPAYCSELRIRLDSTARKSGAGNCSAGASGCATSSVRRMSRRCATALQAASCHRAAVWALSRAKRSAASPPRASIR